MPVNAPGTQFVNTAKWDFGRLIDGVFYEPLPGEWGISPPLTIARAGARGHEDRSRDARPDAEPRRVGTVRARRANSGLTDAWNVTFVDRLPDGATGGMCDLTPQILSARVFAADGVTPVRARARWSQGTDYTLELHRRADLRAHAHDAHAGGRRSARTSA